MLDRREACDLNCRTGLHGFIERHGHRCFYPNGEIDLVMPIDATARFDGHGAGWVVYGPDSAHVPTVTGGKALVLYLLPRGAIEFTKTP